LLRLMNEGRLVEDAWERRFYEMALKASGAVQASRWTALPATEMTGMANTSSIWVTNAIQVKTGIFISDMPGARMLSTVTIRLMAPTSEAMPVIYRPMA
jgi:hypothetical protein